MSEYQSMLPEVAEGVYADRLGVLDSRDKVIADIAEQEYLEILDAPMDVMEIVGNMPDASAMQIGHAIIACINGVSSGLEALAIVSLIGATGQVEVMRLATAKAMAKIEGMENVI